MAPRPSDDDAQRLVGFMSNDAWDALIACLDERIARMEALPDGETKQQVFDLLNDIDAMHREALHRLVRLFKEGVLEKVVSDPSIHTLMELYDLLPDPAPLPTKPAFPTIPIRALGAEVPKAPVRYPHWVPLLASADALPSGGLQGGFVIDGQPLLLARRDDQWFALDASCAVDGTPLQGAHLNGFMLTCPNHGGCHYDIRDGTRIGGGPGIACHCVRTNEHGRVMVGLDMDFKPALPSF